MSQAKSGELNERSTLKTILDSLDALIYVADMETHELLYMNEYGKRKWGAYQGKKCYEIIQKGQSEPCAFCSNHLLVDSAGKSKGPFVWEIQNTKTRRWYQCRDQAIPWTNGRLVRMEIATDITDRKGMEEELKQAKRTAEILAYTDELTGLHNRRAFFTMGHKALSHAERRGEPASLVMFDADKFKQINDLHGQHRRPGTGNRRRNHTALGEECGHRCGEEFAILMLGTSRDQARHLAERLRRSISAQRVVVDNGELQCTASFGIASTEHGCYSLEKLLSQADRAMYLAKTRGRNQVVDGADQISS